MRHFNIAARLIYVAKSLHLQSQRQFGFAAISQRNSIGFPLRKLITRSLKTNNIRTLTICQPSAAANSSTALQCLKLTVEVFGDPMGHELLSRSVRHPRQTARAHAERDGGAFTDVLPVRRLLGDERAAGENVLKCVCTFTRALETISPILCKMYS